MEASTESRDKERDEEQREQESQDGSRDGDAAGVGKIEEIQGVVIEAVFPEEDLPEINNALEVDFDSPEEEEGVSAGTSAVANCPLAMLANSTLPFTRMSAGGTTAVWATMSRPLPAPTAARSLANTETTGL